MSDKIFERFREYLGVSRFNSVRLSIASPDKVQALSYGEVKKIETLNYRTLKPEKDGLFCAKIFGPMKDWECNCGKYKRMKHRGVTCEKCGVEVIQSRVRRERMGHIKLVCPVTHIWFLKGIPSYMSLILEMPVRDIERAVYFESYVVIRQGSSPWPMKSIVSNLDYENYTRENPQDLDFIAEMGADAISKLLCAIDLKFELHKSSADLDGKSMALTKQRLIKRCKILKGMLDSGVSPDSMIIRNLAVLSPDLRPLVPIDGGRFASSDLNDLYRRVLNRNIRLKRLIELEAPTIIIKNEKRMLQESVDALIDNGRRGQAVRGSNKRPLKSLSELLRGKQGRFRQNLLGKRVDYSGRSVIVVEPELLLHQCGLPKIMALELFKPHVYAELQRREIAPNLRSAKKIVSKMTPEVWEALEAVVENYPVLLNRAPTLHRIGIQAFFPILIEGKAIKLHPLVCSAFNADFDGDQMAVHVPLSRNAIKEAKNIMLSSKNIISPATGKPLAIPTQDMVLGLYFLTKRRRNVLGEGRVFANIKELIHAYEHNSVDLHAGIKLRLYNSKIVETTVGRALFYSLLPQEFDFALLNKVLKKGDVANVVSNLYRKFGLDVTVAALDKIKKLGYSTATRSGLSLSMEDIIIPKAKAGILKKAFAEADKTHQLYVGGAITDRERYNTIIQVWGKATDEVTSAMFREMEEFDKAIAENSTEYQSKDFNPVFIILDSGAKGSKYQIGQLGGMRGLMSNPAGEIMETPVVSNFKEGLSVFEYFVSTHGARKGLADTALKTADAGYLTRRLVDVAQDVVVKKADCGTFGSIEIVEQDDFGNTIENVAERIYGRVLAKDVKDEFSGELIATAGTLVDQEVLQNIKNAAIKKAYVRSPLTCSVRDGLCVLCYGMDLSNGRHVDIGLAVGVIAAQSIGEPGTQLTLRTFHVGGVATGMVQTFHKDAKFAGTVKIEGAKIVKNSEGASVVVNRKTSLTIVAEDGRELESLIVEYGSSLSVVDGQKVIVGQRLFTWYPYGVVLTEFPGTVEYLDLVNNISFIEEYDEQTKARTKMVLERRDDRNQPAIAILDDAGNQLCKYYLPTGAHISVSNGERVLAGQVISTIPRKEQKTKDITGGLGRIVELVEARIPKDVALLAEADGQITFGGVVRGQRRIFLNTNDGQVVEYNVPRSKRLNVEDGEYVLAGYQLTSGSPNVHDILRIMGPDHAQRFLINEIQLVYTSQGVKTHDKHVEIIVRQMLRRVRVVDPGDSTYIVGEKVDKIALQAVNSALAAEGKKIVITRPLLMGITKAALETESFIAAASFQETTRVLSEAAICGQVDYLKCLKSNIAIGRLIPAGTGIAEFKQKHIGDDVSEIEEQAFVEENLEISLDNVLLN